MHFILLDLIMFIFYSKVEYSWFAYDELLVNYVQLLVDNVQLFWLCSFQRSHLLCILNIQQLQLVDKQTARRYSCELRRNPPRNGVGTELIYLTGAPTHPISREGGFWRIFEWPSTKYAAGEQYLLIFRSNVRSLFIFHSHSAKDGFVKFSAWNLNFSGIRHPLSTQL